VGDESAPTSHAPWLEFGGALLAAARDGNSSDVGARPRAGVGLQLDGPFAALASNAGLDEQESEVLALLAAAEASWPLQRIVGELHGDVQRNRVSLGLLTQLFGADHPGPLTLTPGSRLRRAELITVDERGPWTDHAVVLHPTVVWALLGDASIDPDLPVDVTWIEPTDDADRGLDGETFVVVTGFDRSRRRALGVAAALGDRFLCVGDPATTEARSAVVREATITGRGVVVEIEDRISGDLRRMIEQARHLVWVLSSRRPPPVDELPDRPWHEVEAPAGDATAAEWAQIAGTEADPVHRLTLEQLERVGRAARALHGDVDAAVRRLAAGNLDQLTRRIRPTRDWDDIVLSADRMELLRSIVERVMHARRIYEEWGFQATPSRGVIALFSGPSGTGKTLASEIIAGALGLDLFKLDLSSVVSKYIGETEKNLERIFEAASAGNAVLFFDEADSLFGKRSEVKDARDRYANIEVSYLLQRLEAHDGLVVMATNFEKNVDEAFMRRIHVRIEFAMPGPDERARIWHQSFPRGAPLATDVEIDWLASRFEIAGGAIRNAALNAAFFAAARDTEITMQAVVVGLAREYRKLGRLVTAKDFGEYHGLIDDG
jgi:ATP-dependent 26S proteasome regulatory subunit